MRWKTKPPQPPQHNNIRRLRKFAWSPIVLFDYTLWLESYIVVERFYQPKSGLPGWWKEIARDFTDDYY